MFFKQKKLIAVFFISLPIFASGSGDWAGPGGNSHASSVVTGSIGKQAIVENVQDIDLGNLDILSGTDPSASTGTFRVRANAASTAYDVYVTAPSGTVDSTNNRFLLANGSNTIPLAFSLTGGSGGNAVNYSTAASSKPSTGGATAGLGVTGSNHRTGTTYTIAVTPKITELTSTELPTGTYSATLTVNIDVSP